jgi:hypothetical protein
VQWSRCRNRGGRAAFARQANAESRHAFADHSKPCGGRVSELKLDDRLRTLLETDLDSFEKLELVRTLRASGQAMSRQELAAACRFPSGTIDEALADLEQVKVVEWDTGRRLVRLGQGSQAPGFAALMQLYDEDRSGILAVLSSMAMQRIRSMAARTFADAFVIRKKRGDDG